MIVIDCHICLEAGSDPVHVTTNGDYICTRHQDRVAELLTQILEMHLIATDPDFLLTTREPPSWYTKSLPPCSLDPLVVTDPRSRKQRAKDPVSAHRVLLAWADAVAENQGHVFTQRRAMASIVFYLLANLNWILSQPACTRFARHVAASHRSLRKVTNYV